MMAWCRSGDRPSSGSMMAISLVTHTVAGLFHDNFMTMRQATIWRHICWANYRTHYCWIFMKFIGTDGNINTALSVTYQMDMPEFFSRRWIQMNYFVNLFYIAKHALRGNRKFKVVRLCSKLVGDSLWSSGLCMPNFRQIGKKNLWCGGEATINLNAHNNTLVM